MANFLNNLTQQLNSAFNSPVGLKIGKQVYSIINYRRLLLIDSVNWFSLLLARHFPIFLLENFMKKRNHKRRGAFNVNGTFCCSDKKSLTNNTLPNICTAPSTSSSLTLVFIELATHDAPTTKKYPKPLCNLISCNWFHNCDLRPARRLLSACVVLVYFYLAWPSWAALCFATAKWFIHLIT